MSFALTVIVLGHTFFNSIPNTFADPSNAIAASISTGIPNASQSTRRHPDYTYTPGFGFHKVHKYAKYWDDARRVCRSEGGDLAVINSKAEALLVGRLITISQPHVDSNVPNYVYIGFTDREEEGRYVTVDGRSLSEAGYDEWEIGKPNDGGDPWWTNDCGGITVDGLLIDLYCTLSYAFVCELPLV